MRAIKRKEYCITIPDDRGKKYEMFRYPAGELQVRLLEPEIKKIEEADCTKVIANIRDGEVMELALLTDALNGVAEPHGQTKRFYLGGLIDLNNTHRRYRQLILSYLPYSRADRKFCVGDCVGLQAFAEIINNLHYDQVITWDAHSEAARFFIPNLVNFPSDELIAKVVKKIGRKDLLVLLPDKGAQRYETCIKNLGLEFMYGEKVRDAVTGKLLGFKVPDLDSRCKKVLIVDDICDGGGTFLGLGQALLDKYNWVELGPKKSGFLPKPTLYLFVTHGIFSKGLGELGRMFENIYTSSSFIKMENRDPNCIVQVIK